MPVIHLWIGYVPFDSERIEPAAAPDSFKEWILAEDRTIVELEQAACDRQGADLDQDVFPPIQGLRRLLARFGLPA